MKEHSARLEAKPSDLLLYLLRSSRRMMMSGREGGVMRRSIPPLDQKTEWWIWVLGPFVVLVLAYRACRRRCQR